MMPEPNRLDRRPLGTTGLLCRPLGFGCYRVHRGHAAHEEALRSFLERGGDLIDTSANYGDGLSEALVGDILRQISRDRVLLVTKGGYIQGQNLELARTRGFPEIVRYGDGIWHCIHPDFLACQIERSLERLQTDRIDVYLLHNPEYFLADRSHRGGPSSADHAEFYRRIREAFRFLESEARKGRIAWYGISSNNFGAAAGDPTATSVARCLAEARSLGPDHRFRVVQLPLNLFETGAALEANNDGLAALGYCRREGLGVLLNRPLNAFAGERLVRLADFARPGEAPPGADDLRSLLAPLRESEAKLHRELQVPLAGAEGIAALIEGVALQLRSPEEWERAAGPYVIRPLQDWVATMQAKFARDMRWQAWADGLGLKLKPVFEGVSKFLAARQQEVSDGVRAKLRRAGYPDGGETLSRMALRVLLDLEGVSCVLVGMRRLEYVADCFGASPAPLPDAAGILARFRNA